MFGGQPSRRGGELALAIGGGVLILVYVWVLTKATEPLVTIFAFASDNRPKLYAGFLAVLCALPGLLFTLPRAFSPPRQVVRSSIQHRWQAAKPRSYTATDLMGLAAFLMAQVPLPAPWGPTGKAATVANITRSAEIVELSARFANYSVVVLVVGVGAAVMAKVYSHAAALRLVSILLVVGVPVIAWLLAVRGIR